MGLRPVLLMLMAGILASSVHAETKSNEVKKKEQCISLKKEQAAALVARDWENLERLAKDYIAKCKEVFSSQDLSGCFVDIAIANNELGKPRLALAAAEMCIEIYYGNPGCHIEKTRALIALGRKAEARKSLDISERLTRHALENAKRELESSSSEIEKNLHRSSINHYESALLYIVTMRFTLAE